MFTEKTLRDCIQSGVCKELRRRLPVETLPEPDAQLAAALTRFKRHFAMAA